MSEKTTDVLNLVMEEILAAARRAGLRAGLRAGPRANRRAVAGCLLYQLIDCLLL